MRMARVFVRLVSLCSHNASSLAWNQLKGNHLRISSIFTFAKNMSSASTVVSATKTKEESLNLDLDLTTPILSSNGTDLSLPISGQLQTLAEGVKNEPETVIVTTPIPKRIRLRKVILLMSYSGQGYFGMQKNPGTKTIEEDLLQALFKCKYIDDESYKKPQQIHFQRAARTDKSVSAARQIVSMKLPEDIQTSKVNECLPPQIRIMGMKRVTKAFDAKGNCDARTYSYMIPTFAFAPVQEKTTEDYRITPEVVEEVRETLKLYLGTKNYHNFTSRKQSNDPSAHRYIINFNCSNPFIQDGLEYVILRVKGQSFMMHQIRKMIGLLVALMRGFANKDTLEKVWGKDRIDIPRAPGVGLLLDEVHYERYDKRFGKDGVHETLTWEHLNDEVEAFCKTYIYKVVTETENTDKSMMNWLATLPYHTYDVREVHLQDVGGYSKIGKAYLKVARERNLDMDGEDDEDVGEVGDDDDDANTSNDNSAPVAKRQKMNQMAS